MATSILIRNAISEFEAVFESYKSTELRWKESEAITQYFKNAFGEPSKNGVWKQNFGPVDIMLEFEYSDSNKHDINKIYLSVDGVTTSRVTRITMDVSTERCWNLCPDLLDSAFYIDSYLHTMFDEFVKLARANGFTND
jgi:hypothetical protein